MYFIILKVNTYVYNYVFIFSPLSICRSNSAKFYVLVRTFQKKLLTLAVTMSQIAKSKGPILTVDHFKGCLLGALLGDCIGGEFEGREDVSLGHFQMFFINLRSEDFLEEYNLGKNRYLVYQSFPLVLMTQGLGALVKYIEFRLH